MEEDQIQTTLPSSKYSRVNSKTRLTPSKMGPGPPDSGDKVGFTNEGDNRLRQWSHSSRIIRVSRASGGKDRHSKVWTAKGPRDRRVRLSVSTAIQFYDLQDRLGVDQPSKAVEWLIKAAADAIHELPSLNSSNFPPETTPSDDPRGGDLLGDVEMEGDPSWNCENHQIGSVSKSGCSSNNSETSKGSGLSLSRSEIRVKARERARERTAKEKEKEPEPSQCQQQLGRVNVEVNHQHQQHMFGTTSSFTQLLTGGINNLKYENGGGGSDGGNNNSSASPRGSNSSPWLSSTSATVTPMNYFAGELLSPSSTRASHLTSGYQTGQVHVGSGVTLAQIMTFNHHNQNTSSENQLHQQQQQQQHYAYGGDNQQMYQASGGGGTDYNLSFSISSSTSASSGGHIGAGYNNNRGPLQSNSAAAVTAAPALLPYFPRYATTTDGSSVPFFLGGAAVENQHQQFHPTGLQLCYDSNNNNQHSDHKGKGKN